MTKSSNLERKVREGVELDKREYKSGTQRHL